MENSISPEKEASPDWLRSFQAPLQNFKTLSPSSPSSSSSSSSSSSLGTSSKHKSRHGVQHIGKLDACVDDDDEQKEILSAQPLGKKHKVQRAPVVNLDSDSDQSKDEKALPTRAEANDGVDPLVTDKEGRKHGQGRLTGGQREESELRDDTDAGLPKEEATIQAEADTAEGPERRSKRASSTLPLVFGEKVHRSKVLLECEGDALDVSGDVGAVGRVSVQGNEFLLDLKGTIYNANIVPSNTFFVVNIGQSEAKVEAIMNDFVQLRPGANIFEAETMVEGTLEGFGFESDEDRDYVPVAAGCTSAKPEDGPTVDEKKQAKQKAKSNKKPLKSTRGPIKKAGKAKAKAAGKNGGARKSGKKSGSLKRTGR